MAHFHCNSLLTFQIYVEKHEHQLMKEDHQENIYQHHDKVHELNLHELFDPRKQIYLLMDKELLIVLVTPESVMP